MRTVAMFVAAVVGLLAGAGTAWGDAIITWENGDHLIEDGDLIDATLHTRNSGTTVVMTGGEVAGSVGIYSGSAFDMSSGILHGVTTYGTSILDVSGGALDTLQLYDSSVVTLSGGSIAVSVYAVHRTVVHVFGYGFEYEEGGKHGGGTLSGSWGDATAFTLHLNDWDFLPNQHTYDHFVLHNTQPIPEPKPWRLLMIGAGLIAWRRRTS